MNKVYGWETFETQHMPTNIELINEGFILTGILFSDKYLRDLI